ncbi:MAG: hypothetical protein QOI24_1099 [Acidobacteriota bacterium]|jgi:hypothetical protein|nr:hypothetical protein [Acidobacteriota bacterium]
MTPDASTRAAATGIGRFQMPALIVGIIFGAISVAGFFMAGPQEFYRAYLPSFLFWWAIALGSLAVLCLQYVTGGEWGLMIRRPLGAASRSLWMIGLLFIPVILGMKYLYPWMDAELVRHDPTLKLKVAWLNPQRFIIFAVGYFLIWCLWAWRVRVLSLKFYEDRAPETDLQRRKWAASGLLMIVLTVSFSSIDWMMSLEPRWTSTMYPLIILVGCGLSAFVFVTFFLSRLAPTPAMRGILKPSHLRDLGNLMLAFVMLYAYTTFSEFLLIWYANLKEEIPHYLIRSHGTWGVFASLIVIFHFFLPFFMLLMRSIKDNPRTIGAVAVIILVMRYIAIYWLVAPSWYGEHFHYHWMNFTTLVAIGGIWMFEFIRQLKGQTIIPVHETWVEEAIREGAVKINA